jgi:hypothetical protein
MSLRNDKIMDPVRVGKEIRTPNEAFSLLTKDWPSFLTMPFLKLSHYSIEGSERST